MKQILLLLVALLAVCFVFGHDIIVRPALVGDLTEILELDRRVTYEHFKPILATHYSHLPVGQNPDKYLEMELEFDKKSFAQSIATYGNERVHVAYDKTVNVVIGFVAFHKDGTTIELDFLAVEKVYRRLGIGRKLVMSAITTFDDVRRCFLITLSRGNQNTQTFYQSLGFECLGIGSPSKFSDGISHDQMYNYYQLHL